MKTKSFLSVLALMGVAFVIAFYSCSKEDTSNISATDITLAEDEVYMDALYGEVDNLVDNTLGTLDQSDYQPSSMKSTDETPCVIITVDHPDGVTFPKVITFDYGDGCTIVFKDDTITYKGKIIITISDRFFVPGAQRIVTFDNFYINDAKIEGTRTTTYAGPNDEGHEIMQVTLENGKITFGDGTWATRNSQLQREWIRNENRLEDTLYVTGSCSGTNVLGEDYVREITDPIMWIHCYDYNYRWVRVAGTITITNSVNGVTTISFGDGTCEGSLIMNKMGERHNLRFRFTNRYIRN